MSQTPSQDLQDPGPAGGSPKGPFGKIWLFLRQVIDELKKVVVPTRSELINYTLVVLVFVVIVIGIVYALDWVFNNAASAVFGDGSTSNEPLPNPLPGELDGDQLDTGLEDSDDAETDTEDNQDDNDE